MAAPLGDVARAARLQRLVGNRAFVRLLARAVEQRAMVDAGGTTDAAETTGTGHRWVWDPFDHTTTIFMPDTGPNAGGAVQITYEDGTPEELAKLQNAGAERVEGLSPTRAQVMEFLRVKQGTYQESEAGRKARVAANTGETLCYAFTAAVARELGGDLAKYVGGMNPREAAIKGKRGGAFHTLEDRPSGPRPGDVVSDGAVQPAKKEGERRRANFETRTHVGIFKSRRSGPGGAEVWTVVDGGQGTIKSRQEIRERTRIFTTEELEVQIPKSFAAESNKDKGIAKGQVTNYEAATVTMRCGVLKSKLADAGQSADDKLLRGWLDIDEYWGQGAPPPVSSGGVNNKVFVGGEGAAKSATTAGVIATQ